MYTEPEPINWSKISNTENKREISSKKTVIRERYTTDQKWRERWPEPETIH